MKKCNIDIDWNYEHLDFIFIAPEKFYIEAVTSNKRFEREHDYNHGKGGIWEITKGYKDLEEYDFIIRESITRNYYKIRDKVNYYNNKYKQNPWFDKNLPYVVALGSYSQEEYGREYIFPLLALLYGEIYRPSKCDFSEGEYILRLEDHGVDEKEKIPLNIFSLNEFSDVSAIIFSSAISLGKLSALNSTKKNFVHVWFDGDLKKQFKITKNYEEKYTDGLFVFHNPFARSPLSKSVFEYEHICQFFSDVHGGVKSSSLHAHLVGRALFKTENKYLTDNIGTFHMVNARESPFVNHLIV